MWGNKRLILIDINLNKSTFLIDKSIMLDNIILTSEKFTPGFFLTLSPLGAYQEI